MSTQRQQSQRFEISAREIQGEVVTRHSDDQLLLHSCMIKGRPSVIYPTNLRFTHPHLFARLKVFAADHGLAIVEERRRKNFDVPHNKRRPWLPVLLLTISANCAFGETITTPGWQDSLNLSANPHAEVLIAPRDQPQAAITDFDPKNTFIADEIAAILKHHFQAQVNDPHNILEELTALAAYYARFPDVVQLFSNLQYLRWDLKFAKRTFRTDVTGNALTIKNTTVYFDPHVGARLKFQSSCKDKVPYCVASPADALLHELLHVKSILLNTREYIASGGMGGLLYPFKHERKTISMENKLYRSMTAVDGQPRPIRNEHIGRYVLVACSTCLE